MGRDSRELGGAWKRFQRHSFPEPSPDLAHFVDHYWEVWWDYDRPYRQLIVPYPNVHLTFRDGAATINGVRDRHHVKELDGAGGVFGVAFRPGSFRPFLGAPVATITNLTVDASQVFDAELPDPVEVATVEEFLRARLPAPDARAERAAGIVAAIAANPRVTRVDALAHDLGTGPRELQRLFAEYVGVGPKWVIRRYRLREVTERLARGEPVNWAQLAAELGYADQAHFVRDFRRMFGETPTGYAKRY